MIDKKISLAEFLEMTKGMYVWEHPDPGRRMISKENLSDAFTLIGDASESSFDDAGTTCILALVALDKKDYLQEIEKFIFKEEMDASLSRFSEGETILGCIAGYYCLRFSVEGIVSLGSGSNNYLCMRVGENCFLLAWITGTRVSWIEIAD